ncbi:MAG TPA: hypothetical protein VJH91_03800 [Candidatus Paceibacterota bacterium]
MASTSSNPQSANSWLPALGALTLIAVLLLLLYAYVQEEVALPHIEWLTHFAL